MMVALGKTKHLNRGSSRRKIISFVILFIICAMCLIPLLWAFGTSFKANALTDPLSIIPRQFTLDNYKNLFGNENLPIGKWFLNSAYISAVHTVIYLIIASFAAYAFGILEWRGRNICFWLLLSTAMIPNIINLVPLFHLSKTLNINQTHLALILPGLGGVFCMFIMRQFFMAVPKELMESAKIEGLNSVGVFFKIVVPLSKSAFMVTALLTFIGCWNDYLWPSIAMAGASSEQLTLPLGIAKMLGDNNTDYGMTMAGAVMSMLPTFIVYLIFQNKIIESVAFTGSKS